MKRLESSFYAFKRSIERFVESHEKSIGAYNRRKVVQTNDHLNKVFDLLAQDDEDAIEKLVSEGRAETYDSVDFKEDFIKDLEMDIDTVRDTIHMEDH